MESGIKGFNLQGEIPNPIIVFFWAIFLLPTFFRVGMGGHNAHRFTGRRLNMPTKNDLASFTPAS